MTKRFGLTIAAVLSATVAAGGARADVSRTPVTTGCPTGYALMSLDELLAAGPYLVAMRVDATGNDNGSVCALALPDAVRLARCGPSCPVPVLYQFKDDQSPADR
jgi:hypothetical protein